MSGMVSLMAAVAIGAAQAPNLSPAVPSQAATTAPAKASIESSDDRIICKSFATTGTRFVTRDCRTKYQWDQLTADSRDHTNALTLDLNKYEPK